MKARQGRAALPRYLIQAQDEERQRIGQRLHDDFAQQVATISILLSTLKRGIPERDKARLEHIGGIREKLLALAESMRRLSHELDPTVVEHAGLAAALRMFSAELSTRPGLQVRFETSFEKGGAVEILPPAGARGAPPVPDRSSGRGTSENWAAPARRFRPAGRHDQHSRQHSKARGSRAG